MPNALLVPVVAHRLYGRSYVARRVRRPRRRSPFEPFELPGTASGEFVLEEVVDAAHGTRRTLEEVRRLFHEGDSPAYTREWSVNRVWRDSGIQFVLVGVVDQMIDSHLADFLPRDVRLWPDITRFKYANALNVYLFRDLEGAWGYGNPDRTILSDRWELVSARLSREEAWRADVITLCHEIGHMFYLSHQAQTENIMYGSSTQRESIGVTAAQALFAAQSARRYRRPWFRGISNIEQVFLAEVETFHVRGHAGERLPTFD